MGLLQDIEHPIQFIEGVETKIEAAIPQSLRDEWGALVSNTVVSSLFHDLGDIATTDVEAIYNAAKTAAGNLAPQVLSGKVTFSAAVTSFIAAITGEAGVLVPSTIAAAETTLKTFFSMALNAAIVGAAANPSTATSPSTPPSQSPASPSGSASASSASAPATK